MLIPAPSQADGVLLCDLAAALEPVVNRTLCGVERRPKTLAASRHNIEKGMEFFKKHSTGVSLAYLLSNDKILAGDRRAVLGLLEQVKRCYTKLKHISAS